MKTCNHPTCGPICRRPVKEKKWYAIPKQSDKERIRQQQYRKQRIAYLKLNPYCQPKLSGCTKDATTVHHMAGRIGANLLDESTWLPACMNCHDIIERNPAFAKEKGFSLSRLNKVS